MRRLVMGILNVTPDSFYDGGIYLDLAAALSRSREMIEEGADVIDVGGESTRPGARPVPLEEEMRRVLPVIEALVEEPAVRSGAVRISVDTTTPEVARAAIAAGASVLNDVSASLHELAAETGAAFVAMHATGTPADMQANPTYDDVVSEVCAFLAERGEAATEAGVREVFIDPGIGFGKTARHNLVLLAAIGRIVALGWPVLVGTSRKSFIGRVAAGGSDAAPLPNAQRFEGSLATAVYAMQRGAAVVRVHDVAPSVEAARLIEQCERAAA